MADKPVTPPHTAHVDQNDITAAAIQLFHDTPHRWLGVLDPGVHRDKGLDQARQMVANDVGPMPIDPYVNFVKEAMPKDVPGITEEEVELIKKDLAADGHLKLEPVFDDKGNIVGTLEIWNLFRKPPKEFVGNESEAFDNFKTLYNTISKSARRILKDKRDPNCGKPAIKELDNVSNFNLVTEVNNSSRCDAALVIEDEPLLDLSPTPAADKDVKKATEQMEDLKLGGPTRILPEREAREKSKELTKIALSSARAIPKEGIFRHQWRQVAIHLEYKKDFDDGDLKDNMRKCVWGGNHNLRNDPCRRFCYGITAENVLMRIWKFTRAGVVVSEAFNWYEDISKVIEIFALFAVASKTELGWDPTVERVTVNGEIQYMYTIDGQQYITSGAPLSDYRADILLGRGTRVYDVYLRGTDPSIKENHRAMKDLWLREGAELEGKFLESLREKMFEWERKYFLTPIASEHVQVYSPQHKGLVKDSTRHVLDVAPGLPTYYFFDSDQAKSNLKPTDASMHQFSHGAVESVDNAKLDAMASVEHARLSHRDHVRTLFAEVGIPLHELDDLQNYFQGTLDASNALRTLHRLGFVHRDVSTGNVLWAMVMNVDGVYMGVGLLTDLEYHKALSDTFTHDDFRTGTYQFMPIDVHGRNSYTSGDFDQEMTERLDNAESQIYPEDVDSEAEDFNYRYNKDAEKVPIPMLTERLEVQSNEITLGAPSSNTAKQEMEVQEKKAIRFRYSILHDFESLLWMIIWGLIHHVPKNYDISKQNSRLVQQLKDIGKLFPKAGAKLPIDRFAAIMIKGKLSEYLFFLSPLLDVAVTKVVEMQVHLREAYTRYYSNIQNEPILVYDSACAFKFYKDFRSALRQIVQCKRLHFETIYLPRHIKKFFKDVTGKHGVNAIGGSQGGPGTGNPNVPPGPPSGNGDGKLPAEAGSVSKTSDTAQARSGITQEGVHAIRSQGPIQTPITPRRASSTAGPTADAPIIDNTLRLANVTPIARRTFLAAGSAISTDNSDMFAPSHSAAPEPTVAQIAPIDTDAEDAGSNNSSRGRGKPKKGRGRGKGGSSTSALTTVTGHGGESVPGVY